MIRCFKKSMLATGLVWALAIVIAVLVWIRNADRELYIPIIATICLLGIGYISGKLLGSIIAARENQKLLSLLHVDLEPEKFIEAYREIPAKADKGADRIIAYSYLADGYAAAGDPDRALETLSAEVTDKHGNKKDSLICLYFNNRCHYQLLAGQKDEAKHSQAALLKAIAGAKAQNPDLAKNMNEKAFLWENYLKYYDGKPVNVTDLERFISKSQFAIDRLEGKYLLKLHYERGHQKDESARLAQEIKNEGGKHFLVSKV